MKNYFIPCVLVVITVSTSCRKDKKEDYPEQEKKVVVTTVAGEGTAAFGEGSALSAKFHFPEDVAVATDETMYVTDVLNFRIRKVTAGQVSTFAGSSDFDIVNGNGASAKFKNPYSVALDANGNVYTTDENDPRVRKISSAGEVFTYAGTAISGFADGRADTAKFKPGNSIIADAQGNVYVADAGNNRIRKISVAGQVTTIAGTGEYGFNDGHGATAQFASPGGIAIDKQGNLYVMDRGNLRVRKITAGGEVSTIAGSGEPGAKDGNASEAQFSIDAHDIVIDDKGNVFLEDENRIRKITPQAIVSTIAGSTEGYMDGDGVSAKFNFPAGMGIDAKGNLYVADLINNRIRKISFE